MAIQEAQMTQETLIIQYLSKTYGWLSSQYAMYAEKNVCEKYMYVYRYQVQYMIYSIFTGQWNEI